MIGSELAGLYYLTNSASMRTMSNVLWKIYAFSVGSILLTTCDKEANVSVSKIKIPATTSSLMLEFSSPADGRIIPVYFTIPVEKDNAVPAVVILHGSGGLWNDADTNGDGVADVCNVGTLSRQYREWETLLRKEGYAVAFPDSYSPRNTCENEAEYKLPPMKFQISGTFIRNQDALATLALLEQLVWEPSGKPVIDMNNVALIGFSDGGTAVLSTIYDTNTTPANWEWKQSFDGVSYTKEIQPPPTDIKFKFSTAVVYYPGSYHNGYYGNICSADGIYQSHCDVLFHLAENDPLTSNSECLIATMNHRGGGVASVERYPNAKHSFDSNDEPENTTARDRTLQFLEAQLGDN